VTPDELPAFLEELRDKAATSGGESASNAMVKHFDTEVKSVELRRFTHAAGTRTPSPPGSPPALVTGRLRSSFQIKPAYSIGDFRWKSSDRPSVVYARIQEYSGDIFPVTAKYLAWRTASGMHFAKSVYLPARPYMRPAIQRIIEDGSLTEAAAHAFEEVVYG
jgi:hypothetical protein